MFRSSIVIAAALIALSGCRFPCEDAGDCASEDVCVNGGCVNFDSLPQVEPGEGEGEGEGETPLSDLPGVCPGYLEVAEPFLFETDAIMYPWAWPDARDASGALISLNLGQAPCSDEVHWSPFDKLLFVSIPAW